MNNAGCSSHPLHIASAYHPPVTDRVTMLNFTLKGNRHGFKTAMGMRAYTSLLVGCFKFARRSIVKHQKRANVLSKSKMGENRTHIKPIAYPMTTGCRS